MDSPEALFKGRKITVMGLGLLGRGLGDARFLADAGAKLIVTDLKSARELEDSAVHIRQFPNVEMVLGEHRLQDFEDRDFILVAAGVPIDSPYLQHAREHNVPLKMSAALLREHFDVPMIGVTGTRGKSTVTQMIHHTLQEAGKRAVLGGNIRGVSNLQLWPEVHNADVMVMELDSWQLQGFGWAGLSPQIAVFTNFMEDHLKYYNSMEEYFADKANIYRNQRIGDALIAGPEVAKEWIASHPPKYGLTVAGTLPETYELQVAGEHNRENAALAREALLAFGLSEDQIEKGLKSFAGVEGRLQLVREVDGVKIYNDNNATTPQATIVALQALGHGRNIILITGGTDKGVDLRGFAPMINRHVKHLVLYSGSGTDKLKEQLSPELEYEEYDTLEHCVAAASNLAKSGDVLLFSPAFSSFGHEYKNEYDRNDQFMCLVAQL